jgi:hypothetical protein
MRVTGAQLAMLGQDAKTRFVFRALEHLGQKHAGLLPTIGAERLRAMIEVSIERCRHHKAASEKCVVMLVDLSLMHSRDVYLCDSWAQEILSNDDIDAAEKGLRLSSYL